MAYRWTQSESIFCCAPIKNMIKYLPQSLILFFSIKIEYIASDIRNFCLIYCFLPIYPTQSTVCSFFSIKILIIKHYPNSFRKQSLLESELYHRSRSKRRPQIYVYQRKRHCSRRRRWITRTSHCSGWSGRNQKFQSSLLFDHAEEYHGQSYLVQYFYPTTKVTIYTLPTVIVLFDPSLLHHGDERNVLRGGGVRRPIVDPSAGAVAVQ